MLLQRWKCAVAEHRGQGIAKTARMGRRGAQSTELRREHADVEFVGMVVLAVRVSVANVDVMRGRDVHVLVDPRSEMRCLKRHGPARHKIHRCAPRGHAVACHPDRQVGPMQRYSRPNIPATDCRSSVTSSGSMYLYSSGMSRT